jgi:hypothetical protein
MTEKSPLLTLLEMASQNIEAIFDPKAVMMMKYFCERADRGIAMYVSPVSTIAEEIVFREQLPLKLAREYPRWVFVSEAWMVDGMKPGNPMPKRNPRRIEIIAFVGHETATGERLAAHRQIYRPVIGGAKLLPLVFEKPDKVKFVMGD